LSAKIICFLFSGFSFEKYLAEPERLLEVGSERRLRTIQNVKSLKTTVMNIIGRLTRDAEVRNLPNEKQVVNFSIATNDNYRNKQGEKIEQTTYFECAYWISPKIAEHLTKGTLVELSGRAYISAWIGKDGEPHAGLNFHTSQITLHGGGKRSDSDTTKSIKTITKADSKSNDNGKEDDLPF